MLQGKTQDVTQEVKHTLHVIKCNDVMFLSYKLFTNTSANYKYYVGPPGLQAQPHTILQHWWFMPELDE